MIRAPTGGLAVCFLQIELERRFTLWQRRQIVVPRRRAPVPASTTLTVHVWLQVDTASKGASAHVGERSLRRVLSLLMRRPGVHDVARTRRAGLPADGSDRLFEASRSRRARGHCGGRSAGRR